VVISDNEIDDRDLQFINLMCRVSGGLRESIDFIVNDYKKYTRIEVLHTNDVEEQIGRLKQDIDNRLQFTCPCNTKKMADRLAMRLRQDYKDSPEVSSKIICITSEQGRFDAETVTSEWSQSFVIYSPSITTGIDYNPDKPQTVYLFLDGENTVSPHTALQMIARNRNIKQVYICSTGMRNRPEWSSQEEMHASFDGLKGNLESMSILRDQFSDSTFDECTGMFKFTENRFTDLYKKDRWNDNMMRSSYMHNLDRLLEERGFNVVHPSLKEKLQQVQSMYDRSSLQKLEKLDNEEKNEKFTRYLEGYLSEAESNFEECLYRRLKDLQISQEKLQGLIQAHPEHQKRIIEVCTDAKTFEGNRNLGLALRNDDGLRKDYEHSGTCNYDMSRQHTPIAKCLLLREMLSIMNHGMSKKLKSYDLTLCQADYDEKERIEVPDNVWETYKHYHKNKNRGRTGEESKPQTRKEWMMSIYFLAKDLFGNRFIKRSETSKQGVKCYNFTTDKMVVDVAIALMNWSRRNLDDFHHEIVQGYQLGQRKETDIDRGAPICRF